MISLVDDINLEIEWRIKEMSEMKLIPIKYNLKQNQREIFHKQCVPMIYSYLEGFVKFVVRIYFSNINRLEINLNNISDDLIIYTLEKRYDIFKNQYNSYESKSKVFQKIYADLVNNTFNLELKERSIENINLERLNNLFKSINVKLISDENLKSKLDKLLNYRNCIAHGENSYKVDEILISEFIATVTNVMDSISDVVVESYDSKSFLKTIG